MPAEPLTPKQKAIHKEDLELTFDYWVKRSDDSSDPVRVFDSLSTIIYRMRQLRLSSFRGRNYRDLKALFDYLGRMCFHRRLSVSLQDFQYGAGVGIDMYWHGILPTTPNGANLEFSLEGLNGRKVLQCQLKTWTDWHERNELTQHQLVYSLGRYEGSYVSTYTGGIEMHYLDPENRRTSGWCWRCHNPYCKHSRRIELGSLVNQAFDQSGPSGIWWLLDKVWVDLAAARPMNRPLGQVSLEVRCHVHSGQTVKVITSDPPRIGRLDSIIRGSDGQIETVIVTPEIRHFNPMIPAGEVREILPWRLERALAPIE